MLHVFLKFETSVLSNNRVAKLFKETAFSKATMVMQFPAKKNACCPKASRDFPPRKKSTLHRPPRPPVGLSCDSSPIPPESVLAYADVTIKISWMDGLPNFLSYGAPLARGLCYEFHQLQA